MAALFVNNMNVRGALAPVERRFMDVLLQLMVGPQAQASVRLFPAGIRLTHGFVPPLPVNSNALIIVIQRPLWGFHLVVIENDN